MEKEIFIIKTGADSTINVLAKHDINIAEITKNIKNGINEAFIFFDKLKGINFGIDLVYSREEFNKYLGEKTENWVVAHSFKNKFIIFAPEEIEKFTNHKRNEFQQIICHETCHILLQGINPKFSFWMFEGIALNVANQIKKAEIKKENLEYFINECLFKNSGYGDFISHQGYPISYLLIRFFMDNYSKKIVMDLLTVKYGPNNYADGELCKILNQTREEIVNLVENILENKTA